MNRVSTKPGAVHIDNSTSDFPRDPKDLTPEWLTTKLTSTGVLSEGVSINSLAWERIGEGYVGTTVRIELSYEGDEGNAPPSIAAKFWGAHEATRALAKEYRLYEREIAFYKDFIGVNTTPTWINTPRYLGSGFDESDHSFVLLLEDIRDAEPGDHVAGCSPQRAQQIFSAYARMHARWHEDPQLLASELFATGTANVIQSTMEHLRESIPIVLETMGSWFSEKARALLPRLLDSRVELMHYSRNGSGRTLVHGDAHVANALFRADAEPVLLDWQTTTAARGSEDLARFMLLSMKPEDRRRSQRDLIEAYAAASADVGFDRSVDALDAEVDAMLLFHVGQIVVALPNVDMSGEQAQASFEAITSRLGAVLEDLGDLDAVTARVLG